MSTKERSRKAIFEMVKNGHMNQTEAASRLGLSYRQTLRAYKRYCSEGDQGLVHRNRGQKSNRAYDDTFRNKVIDRYKNRYKEHDLGPTLAAEKLENDGLVISPETLRRWLLKEGHWKKKRRRNKHRLRRARRKYFGQLVQMDGSFHHWFGKDRDTACLMNMVDDATGATLASLDKEETTAAAMTLLWRWIDKYGIPEALYTDKKNVYVTDREPTIEEQLANIEPKTAFGLACEKLGIKIVKAHSPQAKGRVERSNGTYQDRFLKELALRRIKTMKTADKLLHNSFCDELNQKFAVLPLEQENYHRLLPVGVNLEDIFCFEQSRKIRNDWTISYKSRQLQIEKENTILPKPKDKIMVREKLDGSIDLIFKEQKLNYRELSADDLRIRNQTKRLAAAPFKQATTNLRKGHKPKENHPWK